jgi:hypothetical protein
MEKTELVHKLVCDYEGKEYLIEVFLRPDGGHFARTVFSPEDVIISDGVSLDDVLLKHRNLLPLAVRSRLMTRSSRLIN